MTEEKEQGPGTPERWSKKRTGTFNLDNLDPEEVARLGEALMYGANERTQRSQDQYDPLNPDFLFVCDFEHFTDEDPLKAEDAYLHLQRADNDEALRMAAMLSPAIAKNNPRLAANTLLKIAGHKDRRIVEAKETAISTHDEVVATLEQSSPDEADAFKDAWDDAWQNQP